MDNQLFYDLVNRYIDGSATDEEKLLVESYYQQLASENAAIPDGRMPVLKDLIYKDVEAAIHTKASVVPIYRNWWKMLAAAVVILALAGTTWMLLVKGNTSSQQAGIAVNDLHKNDINPAQGGATLLLGNGSKIYLDSTSNGKLAAGNNANITKTDGQLLYTKSAEISYNTLTTDKGKSYKLTLADGTQVWLDALSSIRYPTAFPGSDRVVEVTGQAYFEVAHDANKPFYVKKGDVEVKVLGTHFNVNAYDDEDALRVTLLEGSVRLTQSRKLSGERGMQNAERLTLKPGEQAVLQRSALSVERSADLEQVMAWKNGRFKFSGSSMEEIFAQLSRWYDIEVTYEDKINEVFVANISKDVPISKVLALFEMTRQVKFKIEGNKIIVMK